MPVRPIEIFPPAPPSDVARLVKRRTSPFEEARAVYADGRSARSFEHDLILHLEHGCVFSEPEYFMMGRPVVWDADERDILNPEFVFPRERADCWHVYLFAGDMARAWERMPWPLRKISFERGGRIKIFDTEQLKRKTQTHG